MARRSRIATYLMLAGLLGAGVILVVGSWNYSRATRRIDALAMDCEAAQRPFLHGPHDVVQQCDPASLQVWKAANPTMTDEEIRAWLAGSEVPNPWGKGSHGHPRVIPDEELSAEDRIAAAKFKVENRFADRILGENGDRENNWLLFEIGAFALVLICALPRVWYFLLGRLAELASAIRGNTA
jgi:hypothetical protein